MTAHPRSPTGVSAVATSSTAIAVCWGSAYGATGYDLRMWPNCSSPTNMNAVHITELRTGLNAARDALGVAPLAFTYPDASLPASRVMAVDVQELRDALR